MFNWVHFLNLSADFWGALLIGVTFEEYDEDSDGIADSLLITHPDDGSELLIAGQFAGATEGEQAASGNSLVEFSDPENGGSHDVTWTTNVAEFFWGFGGRYCR